jgi:enamine deaminase RidA (YjgF/YER057c/UK114 family)
MSPDGLHKNLACSQVVVARGQLRPVYVDGQNSVDSSGNVVGEDDIGRQAEQVFKNLEIALSTAGARRENIIRWIIYVVQGQPLQPGFETFQRIWATGPALRLLPC